MLRRECYLRHREEISKIPIFTGGRDVAFIAYVVQRMRPAAFPKDHFIISQGFSARAIHFIIEGVVEKVITPKRAGAFVSEQETVKDVLTTGDFFGHEALLCSSRTSTAFARVPASVSDAGGFFTLPPCDYSLTCAHMCPSVARVPFLLCFCFCSLLVSNSGTR